MNSETALNQTGEQVASASLPRESPLKNTNQKYQRRLLDRSELIYMLNLSEDKVEHLIDTRQVTPLRIEGEVRFDSMDIDNMIHTYRLTAQRRAQ